MPSDFMEILLDMQSDLNILTLSTAASNHALSALLDLYNDGTYTPEKNKQRVQSWQKALECMSKAVEEFVKDSARLEAYISGQR